VENDEKKQRERTTRLAGLLACWLELSVQFPLESGCCFDCSGSSESYFMSSAHLELATTDGERLEG
jgi:hypothetical protein